MIRRFILGTAVLLTATFSLAVALNAGQRPSTNAQGVQSGVDGHAHGSAPTASARIAPMKAHTGPLPALPRVSYTPPRPMSVIQQVYDFAAKHPEVLQYVPCYCGCEREGHNGNHDCFVKNRAANGRVEQWDAHGMGCAVCIDVARDALTLFNSGATPTAIRASIDKKYASHFPSSTPTPQPPRAVAR